VILVGKYLAGMARVAGSRFKATDTVWDNGLFPHRIPIQFEVVLRPEHRPPILGDIRDSLAAAFPSGGYGLGILNQLLVPEKAAGTIVGAMRAAHNDIDAVSQQIESLLSDAKALRRPKKQPPKPPRAAASVPDAPTSSTVEAPLDHTTSTTAEERHHTTIEGQLKLFTNREELSRRFASLLNDEPPSSRVLFLHGPGGNGKSLLLRHLRERCC
jgi:hypothetical protein